jgi:hypothetical protein
MTPTLPGPATLTHALDLGRAWFFDGSATVVGQVRAAMFSVEAVAFITGELERELQRRYVSQGRKVTYVFDWTACTGYQTLARDTVIGWARASLPHVEKAVICLGKEASPFVRVAAVTGVGVLRMVKLPVELVDDLTPHLAGLR